VSEPDHLSLAWRKSSTSESGNSIEVAIGPEAVYIRNSRHRSGPMLEFQHNEWVAFLSGVHNREFDLPATPATPEGDK
jgi:hypothetical protein